MTPVCKVTVGAQNGREIESKNDLKEGDVVDGFLGIATPKELRL